MISRLLYLANAGRRQEFYPTKDRTLKLLGLRATGSICNYSCAGVVKGAAEGTRRRAEG